GDLKTLRERSPAREREDEEYEPHRGSCGSAPTVKGALRTGTPTSAGRGTGGGTAPSLGVSWNATVSVAPRSAGAFQRKRCSDPKWLAVSPRVPSPSGAASPVAVIPSAAKAPPPRPTSKSTSAGLSSASASVKYTAT